MSDGPQYERHWKDYYDILDIEKGCADEKIIRSQRNMLIQMVHPDKTPGMIEKYTKDINEAFEILTDPGKRARYWSYYQQNHPDYRKQTSEAESRYKERAEESERRYQEAARQAEEAELQRKQEERARLEAQIKHRQALERAVKAERKLNQSTMQTAAAKKAPLHVEGLIDTSGLKRAIGETKSREYENSRSSQPKTYPQIHYAPPPRTHYAPLPLGFRIIRAIKSIPYKLLAFLFHMLTVALYIIAGLSALGSPYGLYSAYRVYMQMSDGVPFGEATHRMPILLFITLPAAAFIVGKISSKLHEYFDLK